MKSMQVFFVCALIVICSANPIPDEAASTTTTSVTEPEKVEISSSSAKSPESPAVHVPVTDVPAVKSEIPEPQALPSKTEDNLTPKAVEKNLEPQALPSKTEDNSTPKSEEKKREIATETPSEHSNQNAEQANVSPKAEENSAPTTSEQPKTEEKPIESLKSLTPESIQEPAQASEVPAEPKQAVSLVESTVLPAAIASEKKIDAEAPVPIVSENVQAAQQTSAPVDQALKSDPAVSSSPAEPSSPPSVESASGEKKGDSESSSSEDSSEESKEDKKTA